MAKNDARDAVEASILSLYLSWLFKPLPLAPSQHTPLSRANKEMAWRLFIFLFSCLLSASAQQQCGIDVGGRLCPNGLCCSRVGYCGTTPAYCGDGCQSQCTSTPPPPPPPPALAAPPPPPGGGGGDLSTLIPRSTFEEMLKHRGSDNCKGSFYTYEAFIAAAKHFPAFAAVGDDEIRKREIAAFFGQTSHETRGGWETAPDGPFAWGYCWVEEREKNDYCDPSSIEWPCVPGKQYYGRGPIQLSWNYNYGQAGVALQYHLLPNPDLVATDPTVSFKAALWFWMTPQPPKPSCHDVITGIWTPSTSDCAARRYPGYGVITNIINGGLECGIGEVITAEYRIGFYKRYCDIFGLEYGDNLDCNDQQSFGTGLSSSAI